MKRNPLFLMVVQLAIILITLPGCQTSNEVAGSMKPTTLASAPTTNVVLDGLSIKLPGWHVDKTGSDWVRFKEGTTRATVWSTAPEGGYNFAGYMDVKNRNRLKEWSQGDSYDVLSKKTDQVTLGSGQTVIVDIFKLAINDNTRHVVFMYFDEKSTNSGRDDKSIRWYRVFVRVPGDSAVIGRKTIEEIAAGLFLGQGKKPGKK